MTLKFIFLSFILLAAEMAQAGDWSSLYDKPKLEAEKPRLQVAVDYLLQKEIAPFIAAEQKLSFGLEQFDLPVPGTTSDPFSVYAIGRHVELPVLTLLFVEDLARAYGWLWTNRYTTKTIDEYLAMLRYRKPDDFPDHRYPAPLNALHIPDNALADPRVVQMSVQTRRTAHEFLLLHEYAHIYYRHSAESSGAFSESDEEQADNYALEIMKGNSTTPTGVLLVLQGWLFFEAGRPTEHPVTAKRLELVARYLDGHVIEFVRGRPNQHTAVDAIHSIASILRQGAEYLGVPGHQASIEEFARKTEVSSLVPRPLPKNTQ